VQPLIENPEWSQEAPADQGDVFVQEEIDLSIFNALLPFVIPRLPALVRVGTFEFGLAFNEPPVSEGNQDDRRHRGEKLLLAWFIFRPESYKSG